MEKTNKFVAVIGCGYWGKNLIRVLYELGVLNTICDTNAQTLEELKQRFPGVKTTSDVKTVFESTRIRGVVIATPAVTHYELAKQALNAGKDVFVEKPLAMNTKEALVLINLAKEKKKILMVGHILQYHPSIIELKKLIDEDELGKIHYIYSNRLNIGKLRTEENILWSFAPHDISIILMLLEEEPVQVKAFGGNYITKGVYDITTTVLEFRNGVNGHIFVSWLHPFKEQKLIVVGSKVMAVFDDLSEEKLFIYPHQIAWIKGIPLAKKADNYTVHVVKEEPLKEELKHFIRCLETREKPKTDGEEGLRVLRVLELAEQCLSKDQGAYEKQNR